MTNARTLVAVAADQVDDNGRSWIEVMPTADKARNGPYYFTVTADDLEVYAESIRTAPAESIRVDYDHADAGTRAAGWFTGQAEVRDTDNGLRLMAEVQWTPRAQQEIRDGEFRKVSPEYSFNERDARTGLMTKAKAIVAATLTNKPFFKELATVTAAALEAGELVLTRDQQRTLLTVLAAGEDVEAAVRAALDPEDNAAAGGPSKEKQMDTKALAVALGLPETADEDTLIAKAKEHAEKASAAPADDDIVVKATELETLRAQAAEGAQAAGDLKTLRGELTETKIDTCLADAVREGQLLPVQKDALRAQAVDEATRTGDFANVKAFIAASPKRKLSTVGHGDRIDDDGVVIATEATVDGVTYAVDADSAKVAARAQKILSDAGNTSPTTDEYLAAANQAERELNSVAA